MRPALAIILPALLLTAGTAMAEGTMESPPAWQNHPYFKKDLMLGAHRGGRARYPENTTYAFKAAAERWPDILLEGDVHVSADGHLVMIHDNTVDRTTNGTGAVADMTLAELQALDAAYRFSPKGRDDFPLRGQGITIPTLAEALVAATNHRFLVEMKGGKNVAEKLVQTVRKANAMDRFMVASFVPAFMDALREMAPEMLTCYDFGSAMKLVTALRGGHWEAYEATDAMLTFSPGMMRRMNMTSDDFKKLNDKGIVVQLHTINRREEMQELLRLGVNSMLTDYPDILAELIQE